MQKSNEIKDMYNFIIENIKESDFYKNRDELDLDNTIDKEMFIDACYREGDKAINKFMSSYKGIEYFDKIDNHLKDSLINSFIEDWEDSADLSNQLRYFYIHSLFYANLDDVILKKYMEEDIKANKKILI